MIFAPANILRVTKHGGVAKKLEVADGESTSVCCAVVLHAYFDLNYTNSEGGKWDR